MNFTDSLDTRELLVKYGKYVVIIVFLIVVFIVLKGCSGGRNKMEKDLIDAASKYVEKNNIPYGDTFIEISKLGEIEGTEMCKKTSGVLVTYKDGKVVYKPYLKCDDYESKISNNDNKFITLKGDEIVFLGKNEVYEEKYYTLKSDAQVRIIGTVGSNLGVYTLTYNAYDDNKLMGTATRIVVRSDVDRNATISGLVNTTDPVITLHGDTEVTLRIGEKYREAGWDAVDYKDGKISRGVKVTPSKVDTSRAGVTEIRYTVTNSRGRTAEVRRKVTVVNQKSDLHISATYDGNELVKNGVITITITGSGYSHMVLPNGKITHSTVERYDATYNNSYVFRVYDIYGNSFTKTVDVNNIDTVKPEGTCDALVLGNMTDISVTAKDNKGISGYSYILDGTPTPYMTEASYSADVSSESVSVRIKDLVGNETKIVCTMIIREDTVTRGTLPGNPGDVDTSQYILVNARNNTLEFANTIHRLDIAQDHPPGYNDKCLSFAIYHSYMLYNGDCVECMTAEVGANYPYGEKFERLEDDSPRVILNEIYKQINSGKPAILHVNGNLEGTSRHYVSVVGYKASVKSGLKLQATDLLIIDSYDAQLETMDKEKSRFMISGYDTGRTTYGYQMFYIK